MKSTVLLLLPLAIVPAMAQAPKILSIVNSASFQNGLPSGGALATIFLSGITGVSPGTYLPPAAAPLPSTLAGFSIQANNAYAPILGVSVTVSGGTTNAQINFQVPVERNASLLAPQFGYDGKLVACGPGLSCASLEPLPIHPSGAFFSDANGYAIAQHADYSLVNLQNPARPGETIITYANDFYSTWPPPVIGIPTPAQPLFQQSQPVGYFYLETSALPSSQTPFIYYPSTPPLVLQFKGLAPGLVGVQQINIVIPPDKPMGVFHLFLSNGCPKGMPQPDGCATIPTSSPDVLLPIGKSGG